MNQKSNTSGPSELSFELLLDKYRKDLLNMTRFKYTERQCWYWKEKSDDDYRRLIEMYNEANNSRR